MNYHELNQMGNYSHFTRELSDERSGLLGIIRHWFACRITTKKVIIICLPVTNEMQSASLKISVKVLLNSYHVSGSEAIFELWRNAKSYYLFFFFQCPWSIAAAIFLLLTSKFITLWQIMQIQLQRFRIIFFHHCGMTRGGLFQAQINHFWFFMQLDKIQPFWVWKQLISRDLSGNLQNSAELNYSCKRQLVAGCLANSAVL